MVSQGKPSDIVEQNIGRRENELRKPMTKLEGIGKMANLTEDPDQKVRLPKIDRWWAVLVLHANTMGERTTYPTNRLRSRRTRTMQTPR